MEPEHDLSGALVEQLRARPYLTLAGLAGVGWVVGRGVSVRALFAIAGIAARAALVTTLESALREPPASPRAGRREVTRARRYSASR